MLNLFLYHLSSGHAWFSCGILFLLVVVLDMMGCLIRRPRLVRWLRLALLIAMVLAGASATPLPLWFALPLVSACLAYLAAGLANVNRRRRLILGTCAGGLILAGLVVEAPYHLAHGVSGKRPARLYIVGDSLTAGMGGEATTWPRLLRQQTDIDIHDLSFAGANARSAYRHLKNKLKPDSDADAWVLIGIGGNDMLGSTSPAEFSEYLDQLLSVARGDPDRPRLVVMQELPMVPFAWSFAAHQRRLAAQHGVVLIPKRVLAGVILAEANVLDGLHLSQEGHERMAQLMAEWLGLE